MRNRRLPLWMLVPLLLAVAIASVSCGTTYPRRDPTGEPFPTVTGTSLAGTELQLPAAGNGAPLLLLVGYEQEAQFDLDRWLLGLDATGWRVRTFEVPTLPGLFPRLLAGTIDGGMRRGIPAEDWASVVTVYGDAAAIAAFTGNDDGLTGRVLLLDGAGKVVFFHDRGFSVGSLQRLQQALAALPAR
ncbi:MAG: hypothetical protein MUC36_05070 [Planctomycetes bacterium]|jgi:hypothetical protein|nr:hypothetical protein [Planctomycetota bacterium]